MYTLNIHLFQESGAAATVHSRTEVDWYLRRKKNALIKQCFLLSITNNFDSCALPKI